MNNFGDEPKKQTTDQFNEVFVNQFCQRCQVVVEPYPSGETNPTHGYKLLCPHCGNFVAWGGKKKEMKNSDGRRVTSSIWSAKRLNISSCQCCQRADDCLGDNEKLEVHHVVEIKDNGTDTPENIWILCTACHKEVHHLRTYFNHHMQHFFKAYLAYKRMNESEQGK